MAVSQIDIDALNAAIAASEKQVTLDGQSVTYRSTSDLIEARNDIQGQLDRAAALVSGKRRPKRIALYYAGRQY